MGRRAAPCPGRSGGRRLEPLLLLLLAVLLAASGARRAAATAAGERWHQEAEAKQAKRVRWYLNFGLVEANLAFHAEHRDIVAGGLLCCHGFAFDLSDAGKTRFRVGDAVPAQVESYQQGGLEDLWVVTGISAEAIAAGRHEAAAAEAAAAVRELNVTGIVMDYEPTTNYTRAHVDAYAAFLDALAKAVRGQGGKLGMDVSSWGILQYYGSYAGVDGGLDLYTSMGSTYSGQDVAGNEKRVRAMLDQGLPLATLGIGIGSVVENQTHAMKDYGWDPAKLGDFLAFLDVAGVREVDVWPADLDSYDVTKPFFLEALRAWRAA